MDSQTSDPLEVYTDEWIRDHTDMYTGDVVIPGDLLRTLIKEIKTSREAIKSIRKTLRDIMPTIRMHTPIR
jgi:hypothetical protein